MLMDGMGSKQQLEVALQLLDFSCRILAQPLHLLVFFVFSSFSNTDLLLQTLDEVGFIVSLPYIGKLL